MTVIQKLHKLLDEFPTLFIAYLALTLLGGIGHLANFSGAHNIDPCTTGVLSTLLYFLGGILILGLNYYRSTASTNPKISKSQTTNISPFPLWDIILTVLICIIFTVGSGYSTYNTCNAGVFDYSVIIKNNGSPVSKAEVWLAEIGGDKNQRVPSEKTDIEGKVIFNLDTQNQNKMGRLYIKPMNIDEIDVLIEITESYKIDIGSNVTTPTSSPTNILTPPTNTPTSTPTNTSTPSPSITNAPTNTLAHDFIPSTNTPTHTPTNTNTPTSTPTPTIMPIFPALVIGNSIPPNEHKGYNENTWLIPWEPWNPPTPMPFDWFYFVSLFPSSSNDPFFTQTVTTLDEFNGWQVSPVDKEIDLPKDGRGCWPYWDVIVVSKQQGELCPTQYTINGMCQITRFPVNKHALGTSREGTCLGGGGGSSSQEGRTLGPPGGD